MLEALAAWKAGTWIGTIIVTSIVGGTLVKLFRPEPPTGKAARQLLKRAEADEELQRELLTELKRLREANAQVQARLAAVEQHLGLETQWESLPPASQRLSH